MVGVPEPAQSRGRSAVVMPAVYLEFTFRSRLGNLRSPGTGLPTGRTGRPPWHRAGRACWGLMGAEARETVVYTDGSCLGNPGPGGWAWAVPDGPFASGAEARSTNQRMEITAVIRALEALEGPVHVNSDSTYVVNCFRDRWWEGWKRRGWRNTAGKPVANRDLWELLLASGARPRPAGAVHLGQGAFGRRDERPGRRPRRRGRHRRSTACPGDRFVPCRHALRSPWRSARGAPVACAAWTSTASPQSSPAARPGWARARPAS